MKCSIATLVLALSGCGGAVVRFAHVETRAELQPSYGAHVTGEDCSAVVFGAATRDVNASIAIEHALDAAGSAMLAQRELYDARVTMVDRGLWLVGERCVRVEGQLP